MSEILTVHVTKHFGTQNHEHTFSISGKDSLEQVVGFIINYYAEYETTQRETVENQFWDDLLKQTPFETKEEFLKWLGKMKDYDLCCKDFSYEEYTRDTIKTAIRDAGITDYDDLDEIEAALGEMKSALTEISETVSGAGF